MKDLILLLIIVGLVCFYFYNTKESFTNDCSLHPSQLERLNAEYNELCDQTSLTINEKLNCRNNFDTREIFLKANIKNCDCDFESNLDVDPNDEFPVYQVV